MREIYRALPADLDTDSTGSIWVDDSSLLRRIAAISSDIASKSRSRGLLSS